MPLLIVGAVQASIVVKRFEELSDSRGEPMLSLREEGGDTFLNNIFSARRREVSERFSGWSLDRVW